jgi:putative FmdB family regulatory protein
VIEIKYFFEIKKTCDKLLDGYDNASVFYKKLQILLELTMPVYEFKCKTCGHVFGELRKVGDFSSSFCPECNSKDTNKIFSLFSGSGNGKSCESCSPSPGG